MLDNLAVSCKESKNNVYFEPKNSVTANPCTITQISVNYVSIRLGVTENLDE
jgi:hypothetical protein